MIIARFLAPVLASLALFVAACGHKPTDCEKVGRHTGELAAIAEIDGKMATATAQEKKQLEIARRAIVATGRFAAQKCEKERWPPERIACVLAARSRDEIKACQ